MKLLIPSHIMSELQSYTDNIDYEISGLGRTSITSDKNIKVEKIYLIKQKVSSARTDLDDKALMEFINEQRKSEDKGILNFNWHSHVNMEAFFSSGDETNIEEKKESEKMFVSLVLNKKGEMSARVDVFPEDNTGLSIGSGHVTKELDVEVIIDESSEHYREYVSIKNKKESTEDAINKLIEKLDKYNEKIRIIMNENKTDVEKIKEEINEKVETPLDISKNILGNIKKNYSPYKTKKEKKKEESELYNDECSEYNPSIDGYCENYLYTNKKCSKCLYGFNY